MKCEDKYDTPEATFSAMTEELLTMCISVEELVRKRDRLSIVLKTTCDTSLENSLSPIRTALELINTSLESRSVWILCSITARSWPQTLSYLSYL